MTKLNCILVGHSLSPDGDVAFRSAVVLARKANALLYLLHVVEPYPLYQQMRFPTVPAHAMLEDVVRNMRTQLNDLAAQPELSGLQAETDAHIGKPFVEILRTARSWNANLVVVGVSQRGEGRFLGSTGERVLRKSQVPVLIAKRELSSGPKTVLVPIDFSDCSKKAAEEAIALVRGFGGRVIFFHALDLAAYMYPAAYGAAPIIYPPLTPDDLEPDWQDFLQGLPLAGITWEKCTREGRPASLIVTTAQEYTSDLIVMGTHGRTGIAHVLLGSVAEAVLRLTDCSVLTVRPDAFHFELP
jgi:nucleotide-binding universal stress UspA family protein